MSDREVYAAANPADARTRVTAPGKAGNGALWFGVFAAPAAWAVDELTSLSLHFDYCAALGGRTFRAWSGVGALLTIIGVVMLGVSLSAGLVAWRAHVSVGSDTGLGETDIDRRRFMARAGLLASALFSFGIVLRIVTVFMLSPSWCAS